MRQNPNWEMKKEWREKRMTMGVIKETSRTTQEERSTVGGLSGTDLCRPGGKGLAGSEAVGAP